MPPSVADINRTIRGAALKAAQETDDAPEPAFSGDFSFPTEITIGPGLDGAIACSTKIGYVNGAKGWLVYRGINCFELAEHSTFEETAYLLLFGKLPTQAELTHFSSRLIQYRKIDPLALEVLKVIPVKTAHPMASLCVAISALGTNDRNAEETTVEAETEIAIRLIAQVATLTAAIARLRQGHDPVPQDSTLSHAANFLYMMTGHKPTPLEEKTMDVALILHADHGMNASTFTAMVTNSSLTDMYSTIAAGMTSLKGPLHGGANEKALRQIEEIGSVDEVERWFERMRAKKAKIMGFGHRVYKAYDPRARIFKPLADLLTREHKEVRPFFEIAQKLEEVLVERLGEEKKIFPNVDFYSGVIYKAMGIETPLFTPIFAVSRVAGWSARVLEYLADNRIFRPRAVYTGPTRVAYTPVSQR